MPSPCKAHVAIAANSATVQHTAAHDNNISLVANNTMGDAKSRAFLAAWCCFSKAYTPISP